MKSIEIIPSKSDVHRALICSALSQKPCRVIYKSSSEDIEATKKCLSALKDGREKMYCGESGSTLRFLLPITAALGRKAAFFPQGRLPERPLSPLYEELVKHGCRLSPQGSVPLTIEGQLKAGVYNIPGNVSSQYISGLLMALPLIEGDSKIMVDGRLESKGYADMTLRVLGKFGIEIQQTDGGYLVTGGQRYQGTQRYEAEGDWSAACFWLAAGALTPGGISVSGLDEDSMQGDRLITELLSRFGAQVTVGRDCVKVKPGRLTGITVDVSQIPDMVPVLAVLGCAAAGDTVIKNAERLRIKESDRLYSTASVLKRLGADIRETEGGLIICGRERLAGGPADSFGDHRITMAAAIASLICDDKVALTGWQSVNKSYPAFFDDMKSAGIDGNVERK